MYGGSAGQALVQDLRGIKVEPIPDRIGHYLGNDLIFALNGTGEPVAPKYRLVVNVRQRVQAPLVDTVSGRATSGMLLVDADYRLLPVAGGPAVASGVAFVTASYDRSSQRFANLRAARDAEIRAARSLAEQIQTRLAIDLRRT
ncbi:MAG: LPS assembly lipoprotein LptE [Beijerinckiaceae bacterium]